ncbi:MAG: preQ(1) synthase [Candidatus Omnitrophica bacterium]|nr:preQ(1) synthase [Candidatus Omnitrophota bacterium]
MRGKKIKKSLKSSYEGRQKEIRLLQTPNIEVWKNKYPDKDYTVKIETSEFTCICPKTGLPDFATITIEYKPDKFCLELKSFKMYLTFFRQIGIFHEHVINKIFDDLLAACRPKEMTIIMVFNARGGITTTVKREYKP